jgi:hypothetical protein
MAYYAQTDYFSDPQIVERIQHLLAGELKLDWMATATERVRCRPREAERGLTYEDINVGSYSHETVPEVIRRHFSMAPRGSELAPDLPHLGYTINRKSEVWAKNVLALYEEAKSRRWDPATELPWQELAREPVSRELEGALCQLCTLLSEVGVLGADLASRWVYLINHELFEAKSLLCSQMLDGAKMAEVFRKRALLKGYGLGRVSAPAEHFFKHVLEADSFSEACAAFHLLCGSLVLGVCRLGEYAAPTFTDKRIFRLVMQDVARLVAYGVAHLRYYVSHQPARREMLNESLDRSEELAAGFLGSPELLEPLIVLSGQGNTAAGIAAVRTSIENTLAEYCRRCEYAGLRDRNHRSKLASFADWLT